MPTKCNKCKCKNVTIIFKQMCKINVNNKINKCKCNVTTTNVNVKQITIKCKQWFNN